MSSAKRKSLKVAIVMANTNNLSKLKVDEKDIQKITPFDIYTLEI